MENQELMVNDEVIETTEEMVSSGIPSGVKAVGIGLLVVGVAFATYKFVYKPIRAKIAARKEFGDIIEGEVIED